MVRKTCRILCVAILASLTGFASGCATPQKIDDGGVALEQEETVIEEIITDVCGCEKPNSTRLLISTLNPLVCPNEWRIWPDDRTNGRFAYLYEKLRADNSVVVFMYHLQENSPISATRVHFAFHSVAITLEKMIKQAKLVEFSEQISQLDAEEYKRMREILANANISRTISTRLAAEIRASRVIDNANTEHLWIGLFYTRLPWISGI
ncbi:MAG: hypothetical protein FWB78_00375 [Treponema sp.]|nr:hypothetical protein [Treponema sp.]